jgi:tetratricopeptide (TPR) repeat protein
MKQIMINLRQTKLLLLAVVCCFVPIFSVFGTETDLQGIDDQSPFSPNFLSELTAAGGTDKPVPQLESLYQKFKQPVEQAEIELTIARILCQRTGFVDWPESLKWYDKALVRDLPSTTLAKQFILRGNVHEVLKNQEEALADYVRGLVICLEFNLPDTWPTEDGDGKLKPPPINSGFDDRDEAHRLADRQRAADYRRERALVKQEQDLLMQRYYYVEAIKRILNNKKLDEAALRETCKNLTNRKDRVDEVLRRAKESNPRPWP